MSYRKDLINLIGGFAIRECLDCGRGLDEHLIAPNALGKPILWCYAKLENTWK
jgi:hypothetical protein